METSTGYVLGTGVDELERLGLQHRLWCDAAHALWHRAGVVPGSAVLDVGCGPGHAAFELAQWVASWRARGGDPDVAARLPGLFAKHGLRLAHLAVHQRVARGSDPMFAWPDTWWRTYAPKLVEMGLLTRADCEALFADLDAVRRSECDFILPPPVTELLAVKE